MSVTGLSPCLCQECIQVLLECDEFYNIKYLRSFCELVTPLDKLVASHLVEAGTQKFLVILNLKVLLKIKHKEYGCILPLFLQILRDNYNKQEERWDKIDTLRAKVIQELENQVKECQPKTTLSQQNLFESIMGIDFKEQENAVRQALDCQKPRKIGAFLVHGYDERYGQKIFMTRLLWKLTELKNCRRISINLYGMSEVRQLWDKTGSYFSEPHHISGMSQKQIMDKISECLQTQNLLFIFSEADHAYKRFMQNLINEFWQQIASINHQENYLLMFLIDNKGKVCVKAKNYLSWHFNDYEYPRFPLHLDPASKFSEQLLAEWLDNAIKEKIVPRNILSGILMRESEGGVPELVYKIICDYCNINWDEFSQCLIQ